jgi:hypothetical protein
MPKSAAAIHAKRILSADYTDSRRFFVPKSALICEICGQNYSRTAVASLPLRVRR